MNSRLRRAVAPLNRAHRILLLAIVCLPGTLSAQTFRTESFQGREVVAGEIIVRFRNGVAEAAPEAVTAKALTASRVTLLKSSDRNVSELLREYSGRPDVLFAEPNYLWRKNDVSNDAFFDTQWPLRNTGQFVLGHLGIPGADIRASLAWDIAQGSRSEVIGIVDSGLDYNHPDLAANVWTAPTEFTVVVGGQSITCAAGTHGFNAIARTCDPFDDDPGKHGTRVAGIIGAEGDNGIGISGVSRVASMMGLKFLGPDGTGTTFDAIAAIEFAIQAKAVLGSGANVRILNNSWGGITFSQALLNAINEAGSNNMLVVAAAGNDSRNTDVAPHYPSSFNASNILSVAATDNRDLFYESSNFGITTVHLAAPGLDIVTTQPPVTYAYGTGTSMSTAMVSGAAGLVLSGCRNLTTAELRATLLGSVDPLPSLQSKTSSGGRLNVFQALLNCAGATSTSFTLKSSSSFLPVGAGGSTSTTISRIGYNSFSSDVTLAASAPAGINVSLASTVLTGGFPSTTLTVTVDPGVAAGEYVIHVTGTGGSLQRTAGLAVVVGAPISPGQNIERTWSLQTSQLNRFGGVVPPGLADWYQLDLNSTTTLTVSLYVQTLQGNFLRLLNSSGTVLAATQASPNNILQIGQSLSPGVYFIVASTGATGTGTVSSYSLAVNAPQLRLVNPNSGDQGATFTVNLAGALFESGLTVDAGSDISVSNVVFNNAQSASATFSILPGASLGDRTVRVSTSSGTSNGVTFSVQQPKPIVTSVTPAGALVGTSVDIAIIGANFINPTVSVTTSGPSLTLDNIVVVSTTTITARLTIPANAFILNASIRVNTLSGLATIPFQVIPPPPVLSTISPTSGNLGTTLDVTMTGNNFFGPMTVDAGSGITTNAFSINSGPTSTATVRFTISPTTSVGLRNVTVTTPGGTSNFLTFMVTPGPGPTLTSISPTSLPQTTTLTLNLVGTNFVTGFKLIAGSDITVNTVNIISSTRADVTTQIGATAALGPRTVSVETLGGMSNALTVTILPPPPTLTSITPSSGVQQSTINNVTFVGTNFTQGMTIHAGPLNITQLVVTSATTATAVLTIPVSTQTGNHNVSVVTPSGTSAPVAFTVMPGTPTLTEIQPNFGIRGRDNSVSLIGTNFATGSTTISPITEVNISVSNVTGSTVTANFSISPTAPLGTQNVTVTTPGGTAGPLPYTIYDPFPDLVVTSGGQNLFAGLNGVVTIGVVNIGTASTTVPMVLTDVLPPSLTFVSGSGPSFSCSASGQIVTCTHSGIPFTPFSSTFVSITVAVSTSAPGAVTHTASLPYADDFVTSNNSVVATLMIQPIPLPTFTFSPQTLTGGQQASVSLALPTFVPQDITGTLTLSFSSATIPPADDPAIQFATGSRQVSFVIPAGTLQARFGSSTFGAPILYQTGTVAGSLSFSGTIRAGSVERQFSSPAGSIPLTIPSTPPVVQKAQTTTQGGFAVLITSSSTPRSITEVSLQFSTTPAVQFNCGSISGCSASGSTLTLDVTTLFNSWYATSQFGSLSTLRLPLTISGTPRGSVNVTLKNALGASNILSFSLP